MPWRPAGGLRGTGIAGIRPGFTTPSSGSWTTPTTPQDVVQDAFLNAYQSLASFKGDAEFFTWLYRIAFNTAVSLKRKKAGDGQPGRPAGTATR